MKKEWNEILKKDQVQNRNGMKWSSKKWQVQNENVMKWNSKKSKVQNST